MDTRPLLPWPQGAMRVVPEDPVVWVDGTQRSGAESTADPHLPLGAAPDDPGWDPCDSAAQANRKFWRNTQACAEEKVRHRQLGGDSACPGGSQGKSDMAWGSAVRDTQWFCPSRLEESSSLARESEPSLPR